MNTLNVEANKQNTLGMQKLYIFMFFITSIFSSFFVLQDKSTPGFYSYLWVLPMMFILCSFIAINTIKYLFKKLSVTIVFLAYFIRMVALPLLIVLADYSLIFGNNNIILSYDKVAQNMNSAIFLMCYEAIVVFIALSIGHKGKKIGYQIHGIKEEKFSLLFRLVIFVMVIFILGQYIIYPNFSSYTTFFVALSSESDIVSAYKLLSIRESVPSVFYWSFILVVHLLQVFIPIILLLLIYRKLKEKHEFIAIILSFLIIFLTFSIMTPERITSILLAITLFIVSCSLYPRIRKLSTVIIVVFAGVAVTALLFKAGIYRHGSDVWGFISATINAYFGGPLNIAAALSMEQKVSFILMLSDVLNSIPFMSHFLNDWITTPHIYNYVIKGDGEQVTKIIPMIGQGKFYFGYILAPLLSFITIRVAVLMENMISQSNRILYKYIFIYATILFSIAPVLYNLNIMLSTMWYIFMYFILMKLAYNNINK